MKNKSSSKGVSYRCLLYCIAILLLVMIPLKSFSQSTGELTTDSLVKMGFENVRWTDTPEERVYVVENSAYKIQALGIRKAVDIIQSMGLPKDKSCKLIVTNYNIPQVSLTYQPLAGDTTVVSGEDWKVSYDIGDSWDKVKKEKKKNSSLFKVDIMVYPQLSYMNMIITQIYQVLFDLSPAIEVSLWPGSKLTGQIKIPVYNDGYGILEDKVHPGHITLSQRFRLPYNIYGKATIGYFNADRWGSDLSLFYPFKDERFSLEGRIGYVGFGYWHGFKFRYNDKYTTYWSVGGNFYWPRYNTQFKLRAEQYLLKEKGVRFEMIRHFRYASIGYWNGFKLHYDTKMTTTWTIGGNFYWPRYNTQFSLKGERYLLGEKGIKFEMIRHFRYASIGFYAMKAEHANSNGGFRFQVALPFYKNKRHKYIPRVNFSNNMGIIYNAGNERKYYKQYKAETSDNIMESNSFNPYFIKSELLNF